MSASLDAARAWVVTADMGLGHQRAAYALSHLAEGGILTAGSPEVTDADELRFWHRLTWSYEFLSRTKSIPVVGGAVFGLLDSILHIPPFYPLRDLSNPSPNNHVVDHLVRKGLGKSLLARLGSERLPLISTFDAPTHAADRAHEGDVYSVICDADLNRVWVASKARESRIRYFAPCGRAMRRLKQYGVPDDRIFITGFTLPRENIGGPDMTTLKTDLLRRLGRLDPQGRFTNVYGSTVRELLGDRPVPTGGGERVTVTFAGPSPDTAHSSARSSRFSPLVPTSVDALSLGSVPEPMSTTSSLRPVVSFASCSMIFFRSSALKLVSTPSMSCSLSPASPP